MECCCRRRRRRQCCCRCRLIAVCLCVRELVNVASSNCLLRKRTSFFCFFFCFCFRCLPRFCTKYFAQPFLYTFLVLKLACVLCFFSVSRAMVHFFGIRCKCRDACVYREEISRCWIRPKMLYEGISSPCVTKWVLFLS